MILKLTGVTPSGVSRLHTAIDTINAKPPFKVPGYTINGSVKLLKSEFPSRSSGEGYVIEISIPYEVYGPNYGNGHKVPQAVVIELFAAVMEFQPE